MKMDDLYPLRCTGCGRQFGWISGPTNRRQTFCAYWCAQEEPYMASRSDEQRNALWEVLAPYKSDQEIAALWGLTRTRVNTELVRRRKERAE